MSDEPIDGRIHRYSLERNLTLFEHRPIVDTGFVLLFIGGLYDSFCSVPYIDTLAVGVDREWSLVEIQLSSSGRGWATGDLDRDVEEIGMAVEYIRGARGRIPFFGQGRFDKRIVLMGHSTGSQDVLHYLYRQSGPRRPPVDGAILQAAVSDREGLTMMREGNDSVQAAYEECLRIALNSKTDDSHDRLLTLPPNLSTILGWTNTHVTCKRFLSLASPFSPVRPEDDDLFSSDLSDQTLRQTFGAVGARGLLTQDWESLTGILILLSADDEYTPKSVNKENLLRRWGLALQQGSTTLSPYSGVIAGASHNVKEHVAQLALVNKITKYLHLIAYGDREPRSSRLL